MELTHWHWHVAIRRGPAQGGRRARNGRISAQIFLPGNENVVCKTCDVLISRQAIASTLLHRATIKLARAVENSERELYTAAVGECVACREECARTRVMLQAHLREHQDEHAYQAGVNNAGTPDNNGSSRPGSRENFSVQNGPVLAFGHDGHS